MYESEKETKPKLKLWTLERLIGDVDFLMR